MRLKRITISSLEKTVPSMTAILKPFSSFSTTGLMRRVIVLITVGGAYTARH